MTAADFDILYKMIFAIGLVVCFGLGCIYGGQR